MFWAELQHSWNEIFTFCHWDFEPVQVTDTYKQTHTHTTIQNITKTGHITGHEKIWMRTICARRIWKLTFSNKITSTDTNVTTNYYTYANKTGQPSHSIRHESSDLICIQALFAPYLGNDSGWFVTAFQDSRG